MKRVISFILVAALMLGLVAMAVSVASAEAMPTVDVTGVTAPVLGATPTVEGITVSDDDVSVTASWLDGHTYEEMEGVFVDNHVYVLKLDLNGEGDVNFYNTEVTVDGEAPTQSFTYWPSYAVALIVYTFGQTGTVDHVEFTQLPQLKVGTTLNLNELETQFQMTNSDLQIRPGSMQVLRMTDDEYLYTGDQVTKDHYSIYAEVVSKNPAVWLKRGEATLSGPEGLELFDSDPLTMEINWFVELRDPISKVEISGVKLPALGETFTTEGISVTGAEHVRTQWFSYDEDMTPETKMERDVEYRLEMQMYAPEGKYFTKDLQVLYEGVPVTDYHRVTFYGGDSYLDITYHHSEDSAKIFDVQLKGVPENVEPGAAPAVNVTTGNTKVTVKQTRWVDVDGEPVTAFEDGKVYGLIVELEAKDGYLFSVYSEGYTRSGYAYSTQAYDKTMETAFLYNLGQTVDKLELTLKGAEVGKKLEDATLEVPDCVELTYFAFHGGNSGDEVFEQGKTYYYSFEVEPKDGYMFTCGDYVMTVNGKAPQYEYWYQHYAGAEAFVCLGQKVDTVEVNFPLPGAGEKLAEPTIPEGANYEFEFWYLDGADYGADMSVGSVLEAGKLYYYEVALRPKDGYYFAEDVKTLFNGQQIAAESDPTYLWIDGYHSLKETVKKVELPAWPKAPVVGEKLPVGMFVTAADGSYRYRGCWVDEMGEIVDGAAGADCFYTYQYLVEALGGNAVTEETLFTVGGEPVDALQVSVSAYSPIAYVEKTYAVGKKVIKEVELNLSQEPEIGKAAGVVSITDEENKNYYLDDFDWYEWSENDYIASVRMKGNFDYDKYYFLDIEVKADQPYAITEETVVKINGKEVEFSFLLEDEEAHILLTYAPAQKDGNPNTGDNLFAVVAVALMAITGLAVTMVVRKRVA